MTNNSKRVALITGGAGGIGLAAAQALYSSGLTVALCDLDTAANRQTAQAAGFAFFGGDLSQRACCQSVVQAALSELGGLDVLVNNAGYQHLAALAEFPEDTWDNMLSLMLTAPFLLSKYAWEALSRSGQGRIINIASIHAQVASPFKVAYISAKHGLIGLTRTAALEGASAGITCNAICPAYVNTPLVQRQLADQARTRGIDETEVLSSVLLQGAAIKKLLEPQDVAQLIAYVASKAAWGMTGSVLSLDLGWTAS